MRLAHMYGRCLWLTAQVEAKAAREREEFDARLKAEARARAKAEAREATEARAHQLIISSCTRQEAVVLPLSRISFPPCASVDQLTVLYAACGIGACVQGGQGAGACGGQGGGGGGEAGKETGGAERGARASQAGARAALRAG